MLNQLTQPMRKRLTFALLSLAAAAGLFWAWNARQIVKDEAYYQAVSQYVYAFSGGTIGRTEPIRIRFNNPAVATEQVGKKAAANLLRFSPKIKGDLVWEDDRTLKIQPSEVLESGKRYTARLNLEQLYSEVPDKAEVFEFNFNARKTACTLETDGISNSDPANPRVQKITGVVRVNENADPAQVEKILDADFGNQDLAVNWNHEADGKTHRFSIEGILRGQAPGKVKVHWTGAPIGANEEGYIDHVVGGFDNFTLLNVRAVQVEEQYILLNFSDPVDPSQDLNGLIRIDEYKGKLRFVTDGNFVRVFPAERISGERNIHISRGIRSTNGQSIDGDGDWLIRFEDLKPAVRLVGRGAVVPQQSNGSVLFPFEAAGLKMVDVEVFKIFNSNILQYLQVNEIEGDQQLERVGKIILQKQIKLADLNPEAGIGNWQRYAFDLKDMIAKDPGAIYQVRIAFRKSYTNASCAAPDKGSSEEGLMQSDDDELAVTIGEKDEWGNYKSIIGGWRGIYWEDDGEEEWWGEDGYDWDARENPCDKEYYYSEHFAQRNVFVSDLGLTAKAGRDGSLFVALTDLHTAQPVPNLEFELFSYQLQPITKARTGADGTALLENLRDKPFVVAVNSGNRRGYLRMADGNTLSLSRFDVAGTEAQKGLKGYLYGERGVWRPGDSLYLNFVLEDKSGKMPANHPLTFELIDPRGALQYRRVTSVNTRGVYPLHCATRAEAPTGNWTARVLVGSATFTRQLKIETVKPNRLRMALDFGKKDLGVGDENLNAKFSSSWLHGATARNLKTKIELQMRAVKTEFKNYKGYAFDDPSRGFWSEPQVLFEGNTDQNGNATVPLKLGDINQAPGKLIANFRMRIFENGGDFSTDNFAMDYFPYPNFVGVYMPTDKWGSKSISPQGGTVNFVCVDKNGQPRANQEIQVALYRCDWRWWWDEDAASGVGQFNSSEFNDALDHVTLTTDARGQASWKVKPGNWGRYFVRALDEEGGHAAGDFFWTGAPDNLDDIKSRNAAAMLPFTVEKEKYEVGQDVTLKVPASESGRILLTLENGSRVLKHLWFDAKAGDNFLKFKAEENMAPTVYAHVSLIQPHAQTKNDLPIRMYGVMPVNVENAATHLTPKIVMPDVLKPDEAFTVSVSEANGRAGAYTLAIVDEGLLDLTRFKTPNPWETFYSREALGVKTWDIFDYVLGAYGASLERILGIGGDGINQKAKNGAQINRFKPCVIHVGPFYLEKGQVAKHRLKIENYVGSVRVMAVMSAPAAAGQSAYGSAEKTCPVRKPLMIMPTLPRVLGPNETLRLPVEVFAMEKSVQNATITVKEQSGLVQVANPSMNLSFAEPGQKMAAFDLVVGKKTGAAKFIITAQGGGETASQEIEIAVRNPNPVMTNVVEGVIEPGKEWAPTLNPSQYTDMSNAVIEVSALPSINLGKHMEYLIRYPHGCVEQTTSAAFPQLYVDILTPLSPEQQLAIGKNVNAAINRLRDFQTSNGGFAYWRGETSVNPWATSYVGHFMIEAKNKGYAIPEGLIDRWAAYQTEACRSWSVKKENYYHDDLDQAYRLYTLALAGKPAIGEMNRMRERKDMYEQAATTLAAAYSMAGKSEAARDIIANRSWRADWRYDWCGYTYGSDLRDRALLLETYTNVGDFARAEAMVNYISSDLSSTENRWYWNTQTLATCLRAMSKYVSKTFKGGPAYTYRIGSSGAKTGDNLRAINLINFTDQAASATQVAVKNNGSNRLYARVVITAAPTAGVPPTPPSNIALAVRYLDSKGAVLNPTRIAQGTDFVAEITVKRNSTLGFPFRDLALTQIFPSGWEVMNPRMGNFMGASNSPMTYQDIRDDRVYTYFNLSNSLWSAAKNETVTYRIQLNAAYAGRYFLPPVSCEGMYDSRIRAANSGEWVEVSL